MAKYKINMSGARSVYDIHEKIQEGLKFPGYYGKNLDALWDCLTDMDSPVEIHIYGTRMLGKEMNDFFTESIIKIFDEVKAWFAEAGEKFEFTICEEKYN
ncbi:MAG: barstar family protein [Clostridia bacterium]|nr:barstar family protein [Clostridia bacterium]